MNRVLVTGGAGFVGHHLCARLLGMGCEVNVIDDLSTGYVENLAEGVRFFEGDIRDRKLLKESIGGCDTVFHLAARVELQKSIEDPMDCFDVNVSGTSQVIKACLGEKKRRLVFASSCAVYPLHPNGALTEEMAIPGETPYALSKRTGEETINIYNRLEGLNACSLRCFNIYGPKQRVNSPYAAVIPKFMDLALSDKEMTIFGDGKQTRDFIFVADMVDAYILAGENSCPGVFNVGSSEMTSINELAYKIQEIASGGKINHLPAKSGDASISLSNIDKARLELGFDPKIELDQGLRAVYDEMKKVGS